MKNSLVLCTMYLIKRTQISDTQIYLLFQGNITRCIDPNQCYTAPPILPTDFSVEYNYTLESSNTVNTTLQYSCTKESKFLLAYSV